MKWLRLDVREVSSAWRMIAVAWSLWAGLLFLMLGSLAMYIMQPLLTDSGHYPPLRFIRRQLDHIEIDPAVAGIAWCVWLFLMVVALYVRSQAYTRFWRGPTVSPLGFVLGNLVAWLLDDVGVLLMVALACIDGDLELVVVVVIGTGILIHALMVPISRIKSLDSERALSHA